MRRLPATLLLIAAAGPAPPGLAAQVVDSIHPIEVELARFQTAAGPPVGALAAGAPSREELVRRFVRGVETRDTALLASLLISRAEFAYLYYPGTPYTRPPYRQAPGLVWFRMAAQSQRGLHRILARDGGRPLGYAGHRCGGRPRREGANRIWTACSVEVRRGGERGARRLFGSIVEREGRFKFLSYASEY